MTHAEQLGRDCVKRAAKRWGHGWSLLGYALQRAVVCEEIVHVLLLQADATNIDHPQAVGRAALVVLDEKQHDDSDTSLKDARIAELKSALWKLRCDSTANDFNEHWDSYTKATELLNNES